jgi:Phasin protein
VADERHVARPQHETAGPMAGFSPNFDFWLAGGQDAVQGWMRGMFSVSQEIAKFAQARLQEDTNAWMKLAACRNYADVLAWQQHCIENATSQYAEEASTLSRLMMAHGDGAAPSRSRHADKASR